MEAKNQTIYYGQMSNREWPIYLAVTEKGLCFIGSLGGGKKELKEWMNKTNSSDMYKEDQNKIASYATQLEEYFKGKRTKFNLPLDTKGTAFQKKVWAGLATIPYGETITYGELAEIIGHPRSFRAVGAAIGKNPLLIVIPCHRVVHKDKNIEGYRGPLEMKINLLRFEKKNVPAPD